MKKIKKKWNSLTILQNTFHGWWQKNLASFELVLEVWCLFEVSPWAQSLFHFWTKLMLVFLWSFIFPRVVEGPYFTCQDPSLTPVFFQKPVNLLIYPVRGRRHRAVVPGENAGRPGEFINPLKKFGIIWACFGGVVPFWSLNMGSIFVSLLNHVNAGFFVKVNFF